MTDLTFSGILIVCSSLISYSCETGNSRASIVHNGYRYVTVAISVDMNAEYTASIVSATKDLIEYSSRVWYVATKRRSHFSSITFQLPDSLDSESSWYPDSNITIFESNGGQESIADADIVLTAELSRPYTLQAGGCGMPGERIYIPTEFLLSEKSLREKSVKFIHQWAQYRYGVFTEGGYLYDKRYPLYYSVPGTVDVHVTSCTNVPLGYNFTDSFGESCVPHVNNETGKAELDQCITTANTKGQPLRSSIMYQQILPEASEFCDSDMSLDKSHNPTSPSKHNALCFEESPWFVILRSPDFAKGKNQATKLKPQNITYRFVKEGPMRIVIAVDVSSSMLYKDRYRLVKNAVNKLILLDLPLGSEVGFVFFDDNVTASSEEMTLLDKGETRTNLLESGLIPDEPRPFSSSCIECSLRKSLQLLRHSVRSGLVLLVTSNSTVSDADALLDEMNSAMVRLQVISFTDDASSDFQTDLHRLTSSTGGSVSYIAEANQSMALFHLYMSFSRVLSHTIKNNVMILKEIPHGELDVQLTFEVDAPSTTDLTLLLSGPTFSAISSPIDEDETSFSSPNGSVVRMEKQVHIPAWIYRISSPLIGTYTFKTRWKEVTDDTVFIMVSRKPSNNGTSLTVRTWASSNGGKVEDSVPVKLFAEVTFGVHPVADAVVVATVYGPNGDFVSSFLLIDNGLGDPDVTLHDGVYMRYFPGFSTPGYYNIYVIVRSKDNQANVIYASSTEDCCGSYVPIKLKEPTGSFTRFSGPISLFFGNRSGENVYPPNRIIDLQISAIDMNLRTYTLQWTTAGDDLDHGAAAWYKLKLFSERNEAKRRFEKSGLLLQYNREIIHHTQPVEYGGLQEFTVRLPETLRTGLYYFAVKGVDLSSNYGEVSNIVEIFFENNLLNWTIVCDAEDDGGDDALKNCSSNFVMLLTVLISLIFCINS